MIKVGDKKISLSFDYQTGSIGNRFRLSCIKKGDNSTWINKKQCFDWFYIFRYEDGNYFALYFDETNVFKKKLDNKETLKILT